MLSTRTKQLLIVGLAVGLIAFLFFSGKNNSSALIKSSQHENAANVLPGGLNSGFDFTLLEQDVVKKFPKADAEKINLLQSKLSGSGSSFLIIEQLAQTFDSLEQYALAGYYYQKLAEEKPENEVYWFKAGKKFFEAQATVADSPTYAYFVDLSLHALDKGLAINPANLDAKADQAVNYIEGKGETMKGVGLLREITQVDPDNRKALLYLGILSVQSNQMQKAIERFEKLVSLGPEGDPTYPYYFRYLGQAYATTGNKQKALEAFKQYKAYTQTLTDPRPAQEADQLIQSVQ